MDKLSEYYSDIFLKLRATRGEYKKTDEYHYKVMLFLREIYRKPEIILFYNGVKISTEIGFCYIIIRAFGFNSPYSSNSTIDFIKKYGRFSGTYYDYNGYETNKPNNFLYKVGDIRNRLLLLDIAIYNYEKELKLNLSKEVKIKILKNVRNIVRNGENYTEFFLCNNIKNELFYYNIKKDKNNFSTVSNNDICFYIPEFTRENAIKLCEKHKISKPNNVVVWWEYDEESSSFTEKMRKARDKFLGVLIKEIKES